MTIKILPARLANQIAAGEVVERPASVVKELVENSLDAGATKIEIDIVKGGHKLIQIRDNGSGIAHDELGLALSRHATSKISTLDDLEAILSLGFRGEALASISSVSRLILTSRTQSQDEAWQAYAEGRDMAIQIKPAAHPVGTTVEVHDLFFNTPARRKFLRTEKNEFTHIEDALKRIALSRFDTDIILKHNGKTVRQYRASQNDAQKIRRLEAVCGRAFVNNMVSVELAHQGLALQGWIVTPNGGRAYPDVQFCFVNGRIIKDKTINHAIRQAYEHTLSSEQYAGFVLNLTIDPHEVDVNVHPSKHEVRFHQSRLVHDFIHQTIVDALSQVSAVLPVKTEGAGVAKSNDDNVKVQANLKVNASTNRTHGAAWRSHMPSGINDNEEQIKRNTVAESATSPYSIAAKATSRRSVSAAKTNLSQANGSAYRPSSKPTTAMQQAYFALMSTPNQDVCSERGHKKSDTFVAKYPEKSQCTNVSVDVDHYGLGKALSLVHEKYLLLQKNNDLFLFNLEQALTLNAQLEMATEVEAGGIQTYPLLMPQTLTLSKKEMALIREHRELLILFGVHLKEKSATNVIIMSVCLGLKSQNLQQMLPELVMLLQGIGQPFESEDQKKTQIHSLASWIASKITAKYEPFSLSQAVTLVSQLEAYWYKNLSKQQQHSLLQPISISAVIEAFHHE